MWDSRLEKEGGDGIALLLDYYIIIIIMYYTRELAPSWIACGEVKVLKKEKNFKNSEGGGEKSSKRA